MKSLTIISFILALITTSACSSLTSSDKEMFCTLESLQALGTDLPVYELNGGSEKTIEQYHFSPLNLDSLFINSDLSGYVFIPKSALAELESHELSLKRSSTVTHITETDHFHLIQVKPRYLHAEKNSLLKFQVTDDFETNDQAHIVAYSNANIWSDGYNSSLRVKPNNPFPYTLSIAAKDYDIRPNDLIKLSGIVNYVNNMNARFRVIFNVTTPEGIYLTYQFVEIGPKTHQGINGWATFDYQWRIPKTISPSDHVHVYLWNLNHNELLIDNMQIDVANTHQSNLKYSKKLLSVISNDFQSASPWHWQKAETVKPHNRRPTDLFYALNPSTKTALHVTENTASLNLNGHETLEITLDANMPQPEADTYLVAYLQDEMGNKLAEYKNPITSTLNHWQKQSFTHTLPKKIPPSSRFVFYLSNPNDGSAEIDNVNISFFQSNKCACN